MATFFLILIYLAFISLGLPDSLLGAAWPVMQTSLGVAFESAGILSMIISCGTIVSSFLSGKIIQKIGTGKLTVISVTMTAVALLGFYLLPSFSWLCLAAVPLGLGAGAVDSALNNFVAIHYKAKHMSWLHCFWGIGATLGPFIMAGWIARGQQWRKGYGTIAIIQFILVLILFCSLPLWKKFESKSGKASITEKRAHSKNILSIKGVKISLLCFFSYCAMEATIGLWGASYLVNYKHLSAGTAASWASAFFIGITFGRFISGFGTARFNNKRLIRIGECLCVLGILFLILPLPVVFSLFGLFLLGLGCAPVFPCMLQETPYRFGSQESPVIIGYQMGFAYVGTTLIPPLFGFLEAHGFPIFLFPAFLAIFLTILLISSESNNRLFREPTKNLL